MCIPTALFITVVPAIVVAVAVPEAADTVAILAVKLVLLTLSGSCREKKNKVSGRFQRTNNEDTTKAKHRYSIRM